MPTLFLTTTRTASGWRCVANDETSNDDRPVAFHESNLRAEAEQRCRIKAETLMGTACRFVEDAGQVVSKGE